MSEGGTIKSMLGSYVIVSWLGIIFQDDNTERRGSCFLARADYFMLLGVFCPFFPVFLYSSRRFCRV